MHISRTDWQVCRSHLQYLMIVDDVVLTGPTMHGRYSPVPCSQTLSSSEDTECRIWCGHVTLRTLEAQAATSFLKTLLCRNVAPTRSDNSRLALCQKSLSWIVRRRMVLQVPIDIISGKHESHEAGRKIPVRNINGFTSASPI